MWYVWYIWYVCMVYMYAYTNLCVNSAGAGSSCQEPCSKPGAGGPGTPGAAPGRARADRPPNAPGPPPRRSPAPSPSPPPHPAPPPPPPTARRSPSTARAQHGGGCRTAARAQPGRSAAPGGAAARAARPARRLKWRLGRSGGPGAGGRAWPAPRMPAWRGSPARWVRQPSRDVRARRGIPLLRSAVSAIGWWRQARAEPGDGVHKSSSSDHVRRPDQEDGPVGGDSDLRLAVSWWRESGAGPRASVAIGPVVPFETGGPVRDLAPRSCRCPAFLSVTDCLRAAAGIL